MAKVSRRLNSPLGLLLLPSIPCLPCSDMQLQGRASFLHKRTEPLEDLSSLGVDLPPGGGPNGDKG
jgi:hypothetical protein